MNLEYVVKDLSLYKTVRQVLKSEFNMSNRLITKLKFNKLILLNSAETYLDKLLSIGEKPIIHSDRGIHYRWPGWIDRMEKNGFIRSMSKKGCSPDNSACEGVFGRIKNEMFYNADWSGVNISEFIGILNDYLYWYNEKRIKKSLGYLSPIEYRHRLGLVT